MFTVKSLNRFQSRRLCIMFLIALVVLGVGSHAASQCGHSFKVAAFADKSVDFDLPLT